MLAVCVSMAVYASKLSSNTMFQGSNVTVMMNSDGSCWVDSRETGRLSGSYDISGSVQPGCSRVSVTFKVGGETIYGELFWPTSGKLTLNFSNIIMEKAY